ncbi:MAG: hypothetical protein GX053_14665, partial [Tissierella sp.]|nr:hypothetical protein [Tissierella sp.]
DEEEAREKLEEVVNNGSALEIFKEFITRQGGNGDLIDHPSLLPQAKHIVDIKSTESGYIQHIEADEVGMSALELGAGRETKDSIVDLAVGIELIKKVGDKVNIGDTIAKIYSNDEEKTERAIERLLNTYTFSNTKVAPPKLINGIVNKDGEFRSVNYKNQNKKSIDGEKNI